MDLVEDRGETGGQRKQEIGRSRSLGDSKCPTRSRSFYQYYYTKRVRQGGGASQEKRTLRESTRMGSSNFPGTDSLARSMRELVAVHRRLRDWRCMGCLSECLAGFYKNDSVSRNRQCCFLCRLPQGSRRPNCFKWVKPCADGPAMSLQLHLFLAAQNIVSWSAIPDCPLWLCMCMTAVIKSSRIHLALDEFMDGCSRFARTVRLGHVGNDETPPILVMAAGFTKDDACRGYQNTRLTFFSGTVIDLHTALEERVSVGRLIAPSGRTSHQVDFDIGVTRQRSPRSEIEHLIDLNGFMLYSASQSQEDACPNQMTKTSRFQKVVYGRVHHVDKDDEENQMDFSEEEIKRTGAQAPEGPISMDNPILMPVVQKPLASCGRVPSGDSQMKNLIQKKKQLALW
ncbi:hypothetical protein VP01_227g2 [Puccinia sorghi]|uniref:Uncharacterized protein n=1 Tax=Puccinia sorghi TaxID=27349 RepID=A0A0L6VA08_9BASI|nr:hypothetical protein VP01_227g2 [Puccinia sorghi]